MNKISRLIFNCSLLGFVPFSANAVGTYYTGGYQSPQQNYGRSYQSTGYSSAARTNPSYSSYNRNASGYSSNSYNSSRYSQNNQNQMSAQNQNLSSSAKLSNKQGFYLNAGISRESAQWNFEMQNAGSILHYDNIAWNVFDVNGVYNFNSRNTALTMDMGLKIGMQSGESTMVDDDITNGGYFITSWVDGSSDLIGNEQGHSLSIGSSSGGSMMGFNIGLGLTDFFSLGNAKITPSIGYRHFNYKLDTKNNYGLSVDTTACFEVNGTDEIQCDPAVVYVYGDGSKTVVWRDEVTGDIAVDTSASTIDTGGTYYYEQAGVTHAYDVSWSGPYFALDLNYDINQNNSVNARIELGMPGYESIGDQPYRFDWQHPKSIEDSASVGSATHLGFGANWKTVVSDSVMFTIGLTYDYYSVSGAQAKTYLSGDYYDSLYDALLTLWEDAGYTEADMIAGDPTAQYIIALEESCQGWTCTDDNEIDSFYKSMGIRVGLSAKF